MTSDSDSTRPPGTGTGRPPEQTDGTPAPDAATTIKIGQVIVATVLYDRGHTLPDLLPEEFLSDHEHLIWGAIRALRADGLEANVLTVAEWLGEHNQLLDAGGLPHLEVLGNEGINDTPADLKSYAIQLRDAFRRRSEEHIGALLKAKKIDGRTATKMLADLPPSLNGDGKAATISLVRWRKGTDLDSTPIRYLVEDMIPAGMLGGIGGRDGRGKTLFGLEIGRCVLTGEKLWGRFKVQQGTVFAMLLDDPENLVYERLTAMDIRDHPNLKVATRADVDMTNPAAMLAFLAEQLATMKPTFILIDALYLFVPTGGQTDKANSGSAMGPVMSALDEVANKTHATVAVVAHDNKAGIDIAGSQVIRNTLKWIVRLILPKEFEEDPEGGVETQERILQLNKLKTGRTTSWHLQLHGAGEWVFQGDNKEYRASTIKDQIVADLADHGDSTVEELARAIKRRTKEVREGCGSLSSAGRLERGERPRADGKPGRGNVTYRLQKAQSGTAGPIGIGEKSGTDRSEPQLHEEKENREDKNLSVPFHAGEPYSDPYLSVPVVHEEAIRPDPDDPANDLAF